MCQVAKYWGSQPASTRNNNKKKDHRKNHPHLTVHSAPISPVTMLAQLAGTPPSAPSRSPRLPIAIHRYLVCKQGPGCLGIGEASVTRLLCISTGTVLFLQGFWHSLARCCGSLGTRRVLHPSCTLKFQPTNQPTLEAGRWAALDYWTLVYSTTHFWAPSHWTSLHYSILCPGTPKNQPNRTWSLGHACPSFALV